MDESSQIPEQNQAPEPAKPAFGQELWLFLWETVKVVLLSLAIIVPIRYYLMQPFFVNGASMEPNFHDRDYIIADKLSYRLHDPRRGDIIIFRYPLDPSEFFIKRVIGLPGETIQIKDNKVIVFNDAHPQGAALDEDLYLSADIRTDEDMRIKLEGDEFFVLGDNRMHSSDSRRWGPLNRSFISGRVLVRLWPLSDVAKFDTISYPN